MSRRSWALVVTLIAGGVVLQIPTHSGMGMGMGMAEREPTSVDVDVETGMKRVELEVTGMT
jgi:hypothetical protein